MEGDLARVESGLLDAVRSADPFLTEIASHLISAGGKRVRPGFSIAAAATASRTDAPASTDAVTGAVAVELVHLGSLYHDDVMDEAVVRRTVDSVNARWGNHEGPEEIQLAVSRDLIHWERPFRSPVITIGELDRWDASCHTTAAAALRVKDEIWLYYSGANYTHGSPPLYRTAFEDGTPTGRKTRFSAAIGLVTWPLHRFVSADAGSDGGVLTTVPIRHRGAVLELNAAVKSGGQIVVELLDAAGRLVEGVPPSEPFRGNDLRHVVRFAGQTDVSATADKAVVLRFTMKNAELYSFAFRAQHN